MVPEVAGEPDACGEIAFGDAKLLAPRQLVGLSTDDLFEPSLLLRTERLELWKARNPVRRERRGRVDADRSRR